MVPVSRLLPEGEVGGQVDVRCNEGERCASKLRGSARWLPAPCEASGSGLQAAPARIATLFAGSVRLADLTTAVLYPAVSSNRFGSGTVTSARCSAAQGRTPPRTGLLISPLQTTSWLCSPLPSLILDLCTLFVDGRPDFSTWSRSKAPWLFATPQQTGGAPRRRAHCTALRCRPRATNCFSAKRMGRMSGAGPFRGLWR